MTCPTCSGAASVPPDPDLEPGRVTAVWCRACGGTGNVERLAGDR